LWRKIEQSEVIVIQDGEKPIGWLRYGYTWDLIPMMNILMIEADYRRTGWGRKRVDFLGTTNEKTRISAVDDVDFIR